MKVPTIGTVVRANVSLFRCPEGATGRVKAITFQRNNGPIVVIQINSQREVVDVSARDYPFFFEEGAAPQDPRN